MFNLVLSVIKSAIRPQQGKNRPLFRYVFPFSFLFLRYWALVSFSPFQRQISPCPPLLPPTKRYRRPLIVTLFICAHSKAAKQCDKWASPCATACVGDVRLFVEIGGGTYSLTSLLQPGLHGHQRPEQQVLYRKISSCPLGAQRGNLLC